MPASGYYEWVRREVAHSECEIAGIAQDGAAIAEMLLTKTVPIQDRFSRSYSGSGSA